MESHNLPFTTNSNLRGPVSNGLTAPCKSTVLPGPTFNPPAGQNLGLYVPCNTSLLPGHQLLFMNFGLGEMEVDIFKSLQQLFLKGPKEDEREGGGGGGGGGRDQEGGGEDMKKEGTMRWKETARQGVG